MKNSFSISNVEAITGLSGADLRNWENRYGFPKPSKDKTGKRYFKKNEVQALFKIKKKYEYGIRNFNLLKDDYFNLVQNKQIDEIDETNQEQTRVLVNSLIKMDLESANKIIANYLIHSNFCQLTANVLIPALVRIGTKWEEGKIQITQEHFASHFIRNKMVSFLNIHQYQKSKLDCGVLSLNDQRHEGGMLALSVYLKEMGVNIFYYGTEIPTQDLLQVQHIKNHNFLCISANELSVEELTQLDQLNMTIYLNLFNPTDYAGTLQNIYLCQESNLELLAREIATMGPIQK